MPILFQPAMQVVIDILRVWPIDLHISALPQVDQQMWRQQIQRVRCSELDLHLAHLSISSQSTAIDEFQAPTTGVGHEVHQFHGQFSQVAFAILLALHQSLRSQHCASGVAGAGSEAPITESTPGVHGTHLQMQLGRLQGVARHVDIRPQIAGMLDQAPTGLEPVPEPLEDASVVFAANLHYAQTADLHQQMRCPSARIKVS
mmetsp:Transcript_28896/g.62820  ORF Transcript_28896/g.62820 Transcript_28896/m.62820 type:complete len:202 (+) Transcript_28896:1943-2548(+)